MAYQHSSPERMLSMALSVTECCFPLGTPSKPSLLAIAVLWPFIKLCYSLVPSPPPQLSSLAVRVALNYVKIAVISLAQPDSRRKDIKESAWVRLREWWKWGLALSCMLWRAHVRKVKFIYAVSSLGTRLGSHWQRCRNEAIEKTEARRSEQWIELWLVSCVDNTHQR